jgi:uncharacterized protein (DUF952 family)
MARIFKILPWGDWQKAKESTEYQGSSDDIRDGFIHFSTVQQVAGTAARHFAARTGLVVVGFEADRFGAALRWEVSRNGDLFPHLYASFDPSLAVFEADLPWNGQCHVLPQGLTV